MRGSHVGVRLPEPGQVGLILAPFLHPLFEYRFGLREHQRVGPPLTPGLVAYRELR